MSRSTASPRLVRARIRQAQALLLRASGLDYETIAFRLGYANRSSAYRAVRRGMHATRDRAALAYRILIYARFEQGLTSVLSSGDGLAPLRNFAFEDLVVREEQRQWSDLRWSTRTF